MTHWGAGCAHCWLPHCHVSEGQAAQGGGQFVSEKSALLGKDRCQWSGGGRGGMGPVGDLGGEGQKDWPVLAPCPWLPSLSPSLSRDPSMGLGVSKAYANVKQKLRG